MYQTLWNSINKQVKNSHAYAAFLAVSLMGWTTIGLLAGFFDLHDRRYVLRYKGNCCPLQWRVYRIDLWFLWRYFISVPDRTTSFN
ncbi:MAG: hypothetical protein ACLU3F_01700 [Blautia wexlerae]